MNRSTLAICLFFGITVFMAWHMRRTSVKKINQNQIIVGTNAEYQPFSFIKDDKIVGFDIDVATEVVERMGKAMVLKAMPFDALLPKLQLGDFHILAAGMTVTPERARRITFTKPYLSNDPLLIVTPVHTPLNNLGDLHSKKVVVNQGYTADMYLSNIPEISLIRLETPTEGFLALQAGRAAAFVAAKSSVQPFFDRHGSEQYHITTLNGVSDNYALVISKKYPELLEPLQAALDAMEEDGTLAELKRKWKLSND